MPATGRWITEPMVGWLRVFRIQNFAIHSFLYDILQHTEGCDGRYVNSPTPHDAGDEETRGNAFKRILGMINVFAGKVAIRDHVFKISMRLF